MRRIPRRFHESRVEAEAIGDARKRAAFLKDLASRLVPEEVQVVQVVLELSTQIALDTCAVLIVLLERGVVCAKSPRELHDHVLRRGSRSIPVIDGLH
jgi:hypothetical protein